MVSTAKAKAGSLTEVFRACGVSGAFSAIAPFSSAVRDKGASAEKGTGRRDAESGLGRKFQTQCMGGRVKSIKGIWKTFWFTFKDLTAF